MIRSLLLMVLLLSGCASLAGDTPYRQFGGRQGLEVLVEDLLVRVLEDPGIGHYFLDVDLDNLHARLVEQFCAELGGPCVYRGRTMRESHATLGISEADFNALVEHLVAVMEARGVPRTARNRLLARLAPMRREIVRP
ncbi:group I truncated hemoglobin [Arenimonas fontis]|uniref:Group 1 truncated hemoglobin n=1 Tax=Arenimonas fontis TaxID=2608255 RepID=A0A5B2ZG20_9GAMM|nr:group 1 truncated hemoglobin [Arenimonas fontis]KAA2286200.1 group 1 truncated hemoglobin [Arenimonas fontis]